jgi:hypothetical protein
MQFVFFLFLFEAVSSSYSQMTASDDKQGNSHYIMSLGRPQKQAEEGR